MKFIQTAGVCAVVALGVGATSATAGSLITSAKIKDGAVHMRDLSPGLQAKIKEAGKPGAAGSNGVNGVSGAKGETGVTGANGETGATGHAGANGADGQNGRDGTNGLNGKDGVDGQDGANGRDGVRYDRLTGGEGEVAIAHGTARLGVPTQSDWAQIRRYPTNLTVSEITELAFTAKSSHEGVTYMKVTTTGGNSIVFSPNTQAGGEQVGKWVTYHVNGEGSTVRLNDDAGQRPQDEMSWAQLVELVGDEHVKDVRVTAGSAGQVGDGALTLVDDITVNDEVIDFS